METTTQKPAGSTPTDATASRTRREFDAARRCATLYGALGATALAAVVALAAGGQTINTFMWVRAVLLPVVAAVVHRMAGSAANGSRRSFERLSTLAAVMPVAVVGVDLIPGVCPLWYAALQAVCVLPVVRIACLTRGRVLRAAFPKAAPAGGE
jgi:hypothetical protein